MRGVQIQAFGSVLKLAKCKVAEINFNTVVLGVLSPTFILRKIQEANPILSKALMPVDPDTLCQTQKETQRSVFTNALRKFGAGQPCDGFKTF